MADSNQQGPTSWADLLNQFGGAQAGGAGGQAGAGGARGARGRRGGSEDFEVLRNRFAQMSGKSFIVLAVIVLVVAAIAYWWFHPPINIHSLDLWLFVGIVVLLPSFVIFFLFCQIYDRGLGRREKSEKKSNMFRRLMLVPVVIALIGVLGGVASLTLFPGNAEKFSTILNTEDSDFAQDIQQADYSTIPFIDRDSAVLLGNRTMGTMADYVSQFEISSLYSQINYKNMPVRVSPLNYADIFKWWSNRETGIPAYVVVNMSTQDTDIVRLEDPIYYSDSDPFFNNVDRYVQLSHPFYIFGEKSFEVDDDGRPYWIYPVIDYTIGLFGGETVSRVILCDASTGECQDLDINEVPSWVDRAFPAELLIQQYNWSGALSNGWINSWLGQSGVKQTTPGSNGDLGYNYLAKDDDVWVYSGVTSATSDNSIIGFVLINQRTAESKFYAVAGATEESAMSSAEGQVQNLKYESTFPLLINVDNQPTYFMALKDNAGLVKKYAMIDIQRYQNVAVGDTLEETEKSYKKLLRANGISSSDDGSTKGDGTASGTISLISQVVLDGNSHYYVMLNGDNTLYDCPVASVVDIVRYKEGDSISLKFAASGEQMATVSSIETSSASSSSGSNAQAA